jgi:hypothetical protein
MELLTNAHASQDVTEYEENTTGKKSITSVASGDSGRCEPWQGYGLASRKSFTIGTMMGMRCINVT